VNPAEILSAQSAPAPEPESEENRTGLSKDALKSAFLDNLFYVQGKFPALASRTDCYLALAFVVRDRLLQRWISTAAAYTRQGARTVAYLSAEFLMGPHLGNNLINLGIFDEVKQAVTEPSAQARAIEALNKTIQAVLDGTIKYRGRRGRR
jgi:starch phosphorylase